MVNKAYTSIYHYIMKTVILLIKTNIDHSFEVAILNKIIVFLKWFIFISYNNPLIFVNLLFFTYSRLANFQDIRKPDSQPKPV